MTDQTAPQSSNIFGTDAEQAAILDLLSYLTPRRAVGFGKIRLGRDGDGGYVLLGDFADVAAALSLGIDRDCSRDTAIAERGIDVHQYDHTVDGPPTDHARFRFFRKQITATPSDQSETLGSALAKLPPPAAGHVVLKIDIEGSEWDVIDAATPGELARFSQVVGEFHDFANVADPAWRDRARRVLAKLRSAFDIVHVHANNWGPLNIVANVAIPATLELTFANRAIYECSETDEVFPTALDRPNQVGRPDIFLGTMRYR